MKRGKQITRWQPEIAPQEVQNIVTYIRYRECRMEYYESLIPVAWIKTDDVWEARKHFDAYYEDGTIWECSRGNPVEICEGGWWILCGFDFG